MYRLQKAFVAGLVLVVDNFLPYQAAAHCTSYHPGHCISEAGRKADELRRQTTDPGIRIIDKVVREGKSPDQAANEVVNETRDAANTLADGLNKVDQAMLDAVRSTLGDDAANLVSFGRLPQTLARSATIVVVNRTADLLTGEKTISDVVEEGIGLPLEVALQQAHDQLEGRGQPIPEEVRKLLAVGFTPQLINRARVVESDFEGNLAALINSIQTTIGDAIDGNHAVTIDDIIVFETIPPAEDIKFWAHELVHVEQYERLGISKFSAEYLSDYRGIEGEAEARADEFITALQAYYDLMERLKQVQAQAGQ